MCYISDNDDEDYDSNDDDYDEDDDDDGEEDEEGEEKLISHLRISEQRRRR